LRDERFRDASFVYEKKMQKAFLSTGA